MMPGLRWLARRFGGTKRAKRALAGSRAAHAEVRELADEVARLRGENHITERVHLAFRGGRS